MEELNSLGVKTFSNLAKDVFSIGSLQGHFCCFHRKIADGHVTFQVLVKPSPVFFNVGSVNHEHILGSVIAINQQIIDNATIFTAHHVVLNLAVDKSRNIVGHQAVDPFFGISTNDTHFTHMRHVKQTSLVATGQVLFFNTQWILDRQLPTAEVNHGATGSHVTFIHRCSSHDDVLLLKLVLHRDTSIIALYARLKSPAR